MQEGRHTEVTPQELRDYALMHGLESIASGRYSSLFVLHLMMLEKIHGIDPLHVIEEMRYLEGRGPSLQTKPASQFKGKPLKGLWHKHFLPALPSAIAFNICNHFGKNGMKNVVEEVLDPGKNSVIDQKQLKNISYRIASKPMEERGSREKITGEWIVFAKENEGNYYLGIWPHKAGDENISSSIKATCVPNFPFLAKYF